MAKYTRKKNEVDAEQFDSSKTPSQWPAGVQTNAASPTGYSYGTLALLQAPMGPGYVMVDGFPVKNLDYIVTDSNGIKFVLSESEFNAWYSVNKAGTFGAFGGENASVAPTVKRRH